MAYIKKYYRKALIVIIPLILLIIIFIIINRKNVSRSEVEELFVEDLVQEEQTSNLGKFNIKGAVVNPGVYSFSNGERVIDAIEKSGGLLENADTSVINLSKNLFDEMVIVIYTYDEVQAMKGENILIQYVEKECDCPKLENDACLSDNSNETNTENNISNQTKISINTASIEQLQTLSGIGDTKAKSIVDYRNENGPFSKIEDIMNVSGIGEAVFAKIKDHITV